LLGKVALLGDANVPSGIYGYIQFRGQMGDHLQCKATHFPPTSQTFFQLKPRCRNAEDLPILITGKISLVPKV